MARLPVSGGDQNVWGDILNEYLLVQHHATGKHRVREILVPPSVVGKVLYSDPSLSEGLGWKQLTKSDLNLAQVDNTSDLDKPVSTATQRMLDAKPNLAGDLTGSISAPLVPGAARRPWVGVRYYPDNSKTDANYFADSLSLEHELGVKFDYFSFYEGLSSSSAQRYINTVVPLLDNNSHRMVLYVLAVYGGSASANLDNIISSLQSESGAIYTNLYAVFSAITDSGDMHRLYIAPMHECNTADNEPWQIYNAGNNSAKYIVAFRLIVDLARSLGVTSKFIQWYMTSNKNGDLTDFAVHYAGDDYVDIIGLTDYNRYGVDIAYWSPPGRNLREAYRMITRMSQNPIWICESSCAPEPAVQNASYKSKANWFREYLMLIKQGSFARIQAYTLFLQDKSATGGGNWSLQSTEQKQAVAEGVRAITCRASGVERIANNRPINHLPEYIVTSTANWTRSGSGSAFTIVQDVPPELAYGGTALEFTKPNSSGASAADYQLYQLPPDDSFYVAGESYFLTFWARASATGMLISAGIRQNGGSNTRIVDEDIALTNGWRLYEVHIASAATRVNTWRLPWFGFGKNTSAGWVRITGLTYTAGTQPPIGIENRQKPRAVTLTDAATLVPNAETSENITMVLGGNRIIGAPVGLALNSQTLLFRVMQDATGSRTVTWNTIYRFPGGSPPVLTTTPNKTDYLLFVYNASSGSWDCIQERLNL